MEKLEAELEHHLGIKADGDYIERKRAYWNSVLELVRKHNSGEISRPVLEVGNGPFGAFLALDRKDTVCIDPLNREYRKFAHFSGLKSTFVDSDIENAEGLGPFATVISYNALDHVDDVERTIRKMLELSGKEAIFLVGVDYYPSRALRAVIHAFRKQIDPPHPHHFTLDELKARFREDFELVEIADSSRFKAVEEKLPESRDAGFFANPPLWMARTAYRAAYPLGKALGMGGKEANLGIKRMAVFVMRKKS